MGPRIRGKRLAAHLDRLRKATADYYAFHDPLELYEGILSPSALRAQRAHLTPPEPPEPLVIAKRIERFNVPYCAGGLEDQPVLLMMELDVVAAAEQEHKALVQEVIASAISQKKHKDNIFQR